LTRHELKEQLQHDHFTDTVSDVVTYASLHRQQLVRWVAIAVAVMVIAVGSLWFARYRNSVREQDLNKAFATADRPVAPAAPGVNAFPNDAAKDDAVKKAFSEVVANDGGTSQGLIAEYYLGTIKAKQGDLKGAESNLSHVADSSSRVASLAKLALAELYAGDNQLPKAQSLLESLVNKPTDLVSKAQAQILLARLEERTNPQQAKKLLQSASTESKDPVIERVVQQVSSQMNK
jgi:predicted negative regulator of RcsB-dependent stress response